MNRGTDDSGGSTTGAGTGRPTGRCVQRSQTTLDFAIGISVFLMVVIFIFLFIPGLLSPFTAGTQEETVTTNRVADAISQSLLGDPQEPYSLHRYCTVEFLDDTPGVPGRCNYDSKSLVDELGLDSNRQNVNVTIRGNVTKQPDEKEEILCWDSDHLIEQWEGTCDSDYLLAEGGNPPTGNDESVTALRVVSLNEEDVTLYVVMW